MPMRSRRWLLGLPGYAAAALAAGALLPRRSVRAETPDRIEVRLENHHFVPVEVTVQPGDAIVFQNVDPDLHGILLVGHEDVIEETFIDPGQSFSVRLPDDLAPGRYELACTIHVDMRGELVVT